MAQITCITALPIYRAYYCADLCALQDVRLTWAGTASETSLMLGPQDSTRSPWPPKLLVHGSGSYPVRDMQLSLQSRLLVPSEAMPGPDCRSTVESLGAPIGSKTLEVTPAVPYRPLQSSTSLPNCLPT